MYVNAVVQKQLASARAMEAPARKPKPGFFASLWSDAKSSAKTVLRWLIVVAGFVLLISAVAMIGKLTRSARSPRKGIGAALEDLSVEAAKRSDANRALGREFAVAIAAASQDAVEGPRAELDVARDLDGSVSLNVRVSGDELAAIEPYLDDGSPVKVGPISVTPRQLIAYLSRSELSSVVMFVKLGQALPWGVRGRVGGMGCVRGRPGLLRCSTRVGYRWSAT